jgi:hypothetical protein
LGAEPRDEIAERAIGEAKALGDIGDVLLVDQDGAQSLIATLARVVGLEEKPLAVEIVHDRSPEMSHWASAASVFVIIRIRQERTGVARSKRDENQGKRASGL